MEITTNSARVRHRDKEVKQWFLTYPRCPIEPKAALVLLQQLPQLPPIEQYLICREYHVDGSPHLHVYVQYDRRVMWRVRLWDLEGHHGNYVPARSWRAAEGYIKKDHQDGRKKVSGVDFISSFDLDSALRKRASRNKMLAEEDPVELVEKGEITIFQLPKLQEACNLLKALKEKSMAPLEGFIPNPFGIELRIAPIKARHFWFWSAQPNTGKTTFLEELMTRAPCFLYHQSEKYQDGLKEGTQFLLFDEFSVQVLPVHHLNQMCDGKFSFPRKNKDPVTISGVTLIICGNKSPYDIYTSTDDRMLIHARFNVIELTKSFDAPRL